MSFTALSLGKAFATSGASTTTLVDWPIRRAYFPRTISPKSDLLYSGRSSSTLDDLGFFMNVSFTLRCKTRADDTNAVLPLRVGNDQQPSVQRNTKCYEATFHQGVIRITGRSRKGISEARLRLLQR